MGEHSGQEWSRQEGQARQEGQVARHGRGMPMACMPRAKPFSTPHVYNIFGLFFVTRASFFSGEARGLAEGSGYVLEGRIEATPRPQ